MELKECTFTPQINMPLKTTQKHQESVIEESVDKEDRCAQLYKKHKMFEAARSLKEQ